MASFRSEAKRSLHLARMVCMERHLQVFLRAIVVQTPADSRYSSPDGVGFRANRNETSEDGGHAVGR
jgi:hypothetical protein